MKGREPGEVKVTTGFDRSTLYFQGLSWNKVEVETSIKLKEVRF